MRSIKKPAVLRAAGEPVKIIEEFFGLVNSATDEAGIAGMISPPGRRRIPRRLRPGIFPSRVRRD
jgi:hypothetical protein